jgi:hypothetical protein
MKRKKSTAMDSQDVIKIAHKAKRETEAFINNYINDRAKGWPVICHCTSVNAGYRQEKNIRNPGIQVPLIK